MFIKTSALLLATAIVAPASAVVVYETDYTTRSDNGNPFVDGGELRFQDGWLGQTGYIVDSDAPGTVTSGGAFLRTLNGNGATGGTAGGDGSGEVGTGFSDGDVIKIAIELQYTLTTAPNQELSVIGVRENFVNGGFDAAPTNGFETAYSSFGDGSIKVYTNFARQGFIGADNAFALFISGPDGGFNSGGNGQPEDLVTDTLLFEYEATFNSGFWDATGLVVTNVDTGLVVADAVDKPAVLESTAYAGSEAFFGQRFIAGAGPSVTSDSVRFEYIAVPEPGSAALAASGLMVAMFRRRRNRKPEA